MCPKDSEKPPRNPWPTLKDGEFFFVPCLDAIKAKNFWLPLGYEAGKNAPVAKIGVFRGMFGVMFYRQRVRGRSRIVTQG